MFDGKEYSAEEFMRWEARLKKSVLLDGFGTRVSITPDGQKLTIYRDDFWKHPWTLIPSFEYDDLGQGHWIGYIEPGFLNGRDVWTFRDGKYSALFSDAPTGIVLNSWRDVLHGGLDSDGSEILYKAGEGYPLIFASMGVKQPDTAGGGAGGDSNAQDGREIRAIDVALIVPRVAANQSVVIQNPLLDDEAITISTTLDDSYLQANKLHPYRLGAFSSWQPPQQPTAIDKLLGRAEEPQTDEIRILTVWALSPPGFTQDDDPDSSWDLYPQYNCFWNLQHASFNVPPHGKAFQPITLHTGLAAGVADLIIAGMLTPINDSFEQLTAYQNAATFQGAFYIE